MKEVKYIRKGKTIRAANSSNPELSTQYKTVNEAKRKSRAIQMGEDGGLGRGCLRVER